MEEFNKKSHRVSLTITHALYKKLKAEHEFKVPPSASYGVIGKLIQIFERRLTSVELNYKGK